MAPTASYTRLVTQTEASNMGKVWKTKRTGIVLTFATDQQAMVMRAPSPIGMGQLIGNLQ